MVKRVWLHTLSAMPQPSGIRAGWSDVTVSLDSASGVVVLVRISQRYYSFFIPDVVMKKRPFNEGPLYV